MWNPDHVVYSIKSRLITSVRYDSHIRWCILAAGVLQDADC